MKTVLFLGAGASSASAFKLPVMSDFFGKELHSYPRIEQLLRWLYPKDEKPNLEDVFAFTDAARHRSSAWGLHVPKGRIPRHPDSLYRELTAYVKDRLAIPPTGEAGVCPLHTRLFSTLRFKDTIVTINYDLVADQALSTDLARTQKLVSLLGNYVTAGATSPALRDSYWSEGFYLKLHGSIDWYYCPTAGCANNARFYPSGLAGAHERLKEGAPCTECGTAIQTLLVPPLPAKRIEDRGRLAVLWRVALEELASADVVVLIGLSLAPTDFELPWLIRQAAALSAAGRMRVEIVNPNAEHRRRAASVLPSDAVLGEEFDSIEAWIDWRSSESASSPPYIAE